jgi:hypothetical protein
MKIIFFLFIAILVWVPHTSNAQAQELEMLLLDIEKLTQMKKTLQNMYDAYTTLENGYNKVKAVTSGNYSLHQAFLEGLLAVSPTVRNYVHVGDIISGETRILSEYKSAFSHFKACNFFNPDEVDYMTGVYNKIVDRSLKNIDALTMVLTAGQTRMSDDERLAEIDRIYTDMQTALSTLRSFNRNTQGILIQRQQLQQDASTLQTIHGMKN